MIMHSNLYLPVNRHDIDRRIILKLLIRLIQLTVNFHAAIFIYIIAMSNSKRLIQSAHLGNIIAKIKENL